MNTAQQCQLPQSLDRHEGKVYFMHLRLFGDVICPKGGYTVAYRILQDGSVEYAVAKCRLTLDRYGRIVNKKSDNFCRKIGRETAHNKLLRSEDVPRLQPCQLRLLKAPHKTAADAIRTALPYNYGLLPDTYIVFA